MPSQEPFKVVCWCLKVLLYIFSLLSTHLLLTLLFQLVPPLYLTLPSLIFASGSCQRPSCRFLHHVSSSLLLISHPASHPHYSFHILHLLNPIYPFPIFHLTSTVCVTSCISFPLSISQTASHSHCSSGKQPQ